MSTAGEPVDRQELLARVDGDVELLTELVDIFVEDLPQRIDGLRQATAAGDLDEVHRAAHALKGSLACFGAQGVFDAANELDGRAIAGDDAGAKDALDGLLGELDRFVPAIRQLANELASGH